MGSCYLDIKFWVLYSQDFLDEFIYEGKHIFFLSFREMHWLCFPPSLPRLSNVYCTWVISELFSDLSLSCKFSVFRAPVLVFCFWTVCFMPSMSHLIFMLFCQITTWTESGFFLYFFEHFMRVVLHVHAHERVVLSLLSFFTFSFPIQPSHQLEGVGYEGLISHKIEDRQILIKKKITVTLTLFYPPPQAA